MSELAADGLTVRRGGRSVLQNVSFRAVSGEFIAIIGANGSGKSTLLMVLAGLSRMDAGTVRLDGADIAARPRREIARKRSYLPQNPRCEWPIPVERMVALGLTPLLPAFGALPPLLHARVTQALAECDLLAQRAQAATTLSGGELARAMLARALVGEPDILIADEPTAGLDPRHAMEGARRLRDYADRGKLVIAALHDLPLAARYATRILALDAGSIAADGTPAVTLTPALLRRIFGVESHIANTPNGLSVDYLAPTDTTPNWTETMGVIETGSRVPEQSTPAADNRKP
jgi:iron complex transport system ATP-binding protein